MRKLLLPLLVLCFFTSYALAYWEEYHPFESGADDLPSAYAFPILTHDMGDTITKADDGISFKKYDTSEGPSIGWAGNIDILLEGKLVASVEPPDEVIHFISLYYFDLDDNGLKDVVSCWDRMGMGIGGHYKHVIIFLQTGKGKFGRLDYDTYEFNIKDFVDLNNDGKYEVLICDLYESLLPHNYWIYLLYKFENFDLKMANELDSRFPKFIWYTKKPNDKEAENLSIEQKKERLQVYPQIIESHHA